MFFVFLEKLLSGFDRFRSDNCLAIWDLNHAGISSSSSSSIFQSTTTTTTATTTTTTSIPTNDDLKQIWKPMFECAPGEQCHSLTWFKPNEKLFAAATTQHNNRMIKVYDPRSLSFVFFYLFLIFNLNCLASSSAALSFLTKAPFNLCADTTETYLASNVDVRITD